MVSNYLQLRSALLECQRHAKARRLIGVAGGMNGNLELGVVDDAVLRAVAAGSRSLQQQVIGLWE